MSQSNSVVTDILQELGWDSGLSIPIANELNKKLTLEIEKNQKDVINTRSELSYYEEKTEAVESHLHKVKQEFERVQKLWLAKKCTVESEEHMCKLAEREHGRLKQEILRLSELTNDLKQRINDHENIIFKKTSFLEELRVQMNWDQQALEAWLEESEKKTEDSLALQKYTRQDESKIKELTLQLEHLTNESIDKRKLLEKEAVDTLISQVEFDKAAEELRKLHHERHALIQQWELTIQKLRQRDEEIDVQASELAAINRTMRAKDEVIREKEQFLKQEGENNYESEKKVGLAERTAAKIRLDYQNAEQQRQQFFSNLETLRRTVERTASELEGTRSQISHLKSEIMSKTNSLNGAKHVRQVLQEKLKLVTESKLSAEEQASEMENLLLEEERRQKEMETELKLLREVQFKRAQELQEVRLEVRDAEANIMGGRASLRNMNSMIRRLDDDILKRQEIIYNQDFQIQQVERRLNRMSGENNNEEKAVLEARVDELNGKLAARETTCALLTTQSRNLQNDIRRVKRHIEVTRAQKNDLVIKIDNVNLHVETAQREHARIDCERQSLIVELNMKKLVVKNLRQHLNSTADKVVGLEKRKLYLDTAMKERRLEIEIHRGMLESQIRQAESERQQVSSELHERTAQIDKLEKRFDIIMVAMAPPDGEEEKSQAYYVIKAAQDKEDLQRKGDKLDAEIRKQEKEKRGLENALRVINSNNEQYRKGFTRVTESSDEVEEKKTLDNQMRMAIDKYKFKRRQLRETVEEIETMRQTLNNLLKDISLVEGVQQEKASELTILERMKSDHRIKLERAEKILVRIQREFRTGNNGATLSEELDIKARESREYNRLVTKELVNVAGQYPVAADLCVQFLQQADIPLPASTGSSQTSSRNTSRINSTASSIPSTNRSNFGSVPSSSRLSIDFQDGGVDPIIRQSKALMSVRSSVSSTSSSTRKSRS